MNTPPLRVGVLGFGGLGQAAAKLLTSKREMILVAVADQKGYAYSTEGLNTQACITTYQTQGTVGYLEPVGTLSNNSIQDLIQATGDTVNGYFLALPNLPNDFIPSVAKEFIKAAWKGVLVDAIKRTSAVEQLLAMKNEL
ncbi:MAG: saccharopine dehydrogenase-like oxidoreductase, partial [Aphanizomenon sp.]|jgi:hypothetical protein